MENNKNKKSVKFQGDILNICDFIQVFVFTRNHHLNFHFCLPSEQGEGGINYKRREYAPTRTSSFLLNGCLDVLDLTALLDTCMSMSSCLPERGGKEKEMIGKRKKSPNNPHPHLLQAQNVLVLLLSKLVGRPGTERYPTPPPDLNHPLVQKSPGLEGLRRLGKTNGVLTVVLLC